MNIDDLNVAIELTDRFDQLKTAQEIKAGTYSRPEEYERTLKSGRGHLRGTSYRGKTKNGKKR